MENNVVALKKKEYQPIPLKDQYELMTLSGVQEFTDPFIKAQDVGDNSKLSYRKSLKPFASWLIENQKVQPDRGTILEYKDYLKSKELSASTISAYIVVVRKFFSWLESEKLYPNIARSVKGMKASKGFKKDRLSVDQVKELLSNVDLESLQGKRDYAMINLMVRTGLRTIELSRANVEDIRQERGQAVLYIQGKGRDQKDDFVILTDSTLKPINIYLMARGTNKDKQPLFTSLSDRNFNQRLTTTSISRVVKTSLRNIHLDNSRLTAHSLRHTAITLCLEGGATIQEAQQMARHSNVNTTMLYSHNINRIKSAPEKKIDNILN